MKNINNINQTDPSLKEFTIMAKQYFEDENPDPENTFSDGALQYTYLDGMNVSAIYSTGTVDISGTSGTFSSAPSDSMAGRAIRLTTSYKEVTYRILSHTANNTSFTISRSYYNPSDATNSITGATFEIDGRDAYKYALYPAPNSTYATSIIFKCYLAMEAPVSDLELLDLPNVAHPILSVICEDACDARWNNAFKGDYTAFEAYIDRMIESRLARSHYRDIATRKVKLDHGDTNFKNLRSM